ncbi:MAG TPA: SHOCT domain-containing protein [Methylomirabilota bacterium]|nr:SHOCT domain-containing protein [Methylomirabilota bacterium]
MTVVAVAAVIRWLSPTAGAAHASGGGDRALELLRERYARDEIDKQEFDAKRPDLGG